MAKNCVFCKIINGDLPSYTVYEDEHVKSFLDISPASRGHLLVLPKSHATDIFEIDPDVYSKVYAKAAELAKALKRHFNCDGINILQNNGTAAGQSVGHFHVHVIPRNNGDKVRLFESPAVKLSADEFTEIMNALNAQM